MDGRSFDRFARLISAAGSRRDAVRAVLGALVFGAVSGAVDAKRGDDGDKKGSGRGQRGDRRKGAEGAGGGRRRKRKRVRAQSLPGSCCSGGNCTPGAGKNLGKCCYEGQNLAGKNFKGANLGNANFSGATLTNANLSSANLDKTCFVGANLQGARLAGANTGTAIFCRTTMPNGSINDAGCGKGTTCCPTCDGPCPSGQRCCGNGTCAECCSDAHCAAGSSCNDGVCGACQPDCDGRECGSDGCDGTCGDGCTLPDECNTRTGRCVCRPECDQKVCGPDGCGSQCGPGCSGNTPVCNASGQCVPCQTAGDCPAPVNGTATCNQGSCGKLCDNNFHRICGSGAGVCQECCNDNQCHSIGGPCVNGICRCPNSSESRCGFDCIDLDVEPNHCGECDEACASGTCDNGACATPAPCGLLCNPQHDLDCELTECPGDKECSGLANRVCTCPEGMVDCDGDGFCEACGRCGVTPCPDDPATGNPGFCCPGGYCSCGGVCCDGPECWVTTQTDSEGSPIGQREHCDSTRGCVDCWGQCCSACINGECASSGPIGGGSIRRR